MLTRELQDEIYVGIFIRHNRFEDARSLVERLLADYDALPNELKTRKYYNVDRKKLEADQTLVETLLKPGD
jgi:hypothetical protein